MKKHEIKVGGHYLAKVSGKMTTVRVDAIRAALSRLSGAGAKGTFYDVTNLATGRKTTFRSAAKFRSPAKGPTPASVRHKGGQEEDLMATDLSNAMKAEDSTRDEEEMRTAEALEAEYRSDPPIAGCAKEPASLDLVQDVQPAGAQVEVSCPRCGQTVAVVDGCYDHHRKPIPGHSYMSGITCGKSGEKVSLQPA